MKKREKEKKHRRLKNWIKGVIIVYCGIGIALYYLQEKLIFHPEQLAPDYQYKFGTPFEEVFVPFSKNDSTSIVRFFTEAQEKKGVVLYFHGNRGNINRYAKYAGNFTKNGYEVWMIDYPGYGKSTGKISEKYLYNQASELYKLAANKFSSDSIIIYGKSLGSGPASWLGYMKKCKKLILETPYYSLTDLLQRYAIIYPASVISAFKFPVYKYVSETKNPVIIFHGTADRVIPYKASEQLKQILKSTDEFITIEDGSHNNLNDFPLFHQKLDSVLNL